MNPRMLFACLVLLAGAFRAPGCSSDNSVAPPPEDLLGSWTWVSSTGGFAGDTRTPGTTGYTEAILFRPDGRFELYRNDSLRSATTFAVRRESTMFHPGVGEVVHYGSGHMDQEATHAGPDTLLLADRCIDCYIHIYLRIH